jgi:hypothetical protein
MRIEIKNISGAIIYSGEFESVRHAIEAEEAIEG